MEKDDESLSEDDPPQEPSSETAKNEAQWMEDSVDVSVDEGRCDPTTQAEELDSTEDGSEAEAGTRRKRPRSSGKQAKRKRRRRRYFCDKCPKSYSSLADVRDHMLIHSGKLAHVCDLCGQGFVIRRCMLSHRRNHTALDVDYDSEDSATGTEMETEGGDLFNRLLEASKDIASLPAGETSKENNAQSLNHEDYILEPAIEIHAASSREQTQQNLRNRNKRLRMQGKMYMGYCKTRGTKESVMVPRKGRGMGPRCTAASCKRSGLRRCEEVPESEREALFRTFWRSMNWEQRKVYVIDNVIMAEPKRRCTKTESRRTASFLYHLTFADQRVQVCKRMFLQTLCIGEYSVRDWVRRGVRNIQGPSLSERLCREAAKVALSQEQSQHNSPDAGVVGETKSGVS